jgi:hypothetical protein
MHVCEGVICILFTTSPHRGVCCGTSCALTLLEHPMCVWRGHCPVCTCTVGKHLCMCTNVCAFPSPAETAACLLHAHLVPPAVDVHSICMLTSMCMCMCHVSCSCACALSAWLNSLHSSRHTRQAAAAFKYSCASTAVLQSGRQIRTNITCWPFGPSSVG